MDRDSFSPLILQLLLFSFSYLTSSVCALLRSPLLLSSFSINFLLFFFLSTYSLIPSHYPPFSLISIPVFLSFPLFLLPAPLFTFFISRKTWRARHLFLAIVSLEISRPLCCLLPPTRQHVHSDHFGSLFLPLSTPPYTEDARTPPFQLIDGSRVQVSFCVSRRVGKVALKLSR